MQALNLFRFSKHLRVGGTFTLEQADALTEALAAGLIEVELKRVTNNANDILHTPEHRKTTAALLAIFLGIFGAHKYYLRKSFKVFYI